LTIFQEGAYLNVMSIHKALDIFQFDCVTLESVPGTNQDIGTRVFAQWNKGSIWWGTLIKWRSTTNHLPPSMIRTNLTIWAVMHSLISIRLFSVCFLGCSMFLYRCVITVHLRRYFQLAVCSCERVTLNDDRGKDELPVTFVFHLIHVSIRGMNGYSIVLFTGHDY